MLPAETLQFHDLLLYAIDILSHHSLTDFRITQ